MIITTTASEFRENFADFIDKIIAGDKVRLTDGRKGKVKVTLTKDKKKDNFNWDEHIAFVKSLGGSGLLDSKEDRLARKKLRSSFDKRIRDAVNR